MEPVGGECQQDFDSTRDEIVRCLEACEAADELRKRGMDPSEYINAVFAPPRNMLGCILRSHLWIWLLCPSSASFKEAD